MNSIVYNADCLEQMRKMPDNSVDAIVTDPPYGLSFMGKKWDYDVPSQEIWEECLRVLKPGGYLLAFAGTRTQHRMAVRIEDAGFEIRDMIAWVYGCLSDDTEILTKNGWEQYRISKQNPIFAEQDILIYDVQEGIYKWEKPERWNEYSVEQDTAFRIQSDNTDQIVSRGHRCLVERNGKLVFIPADELSEVEYMPTLPDDFRFLCEGQRELLFEGVLRECEGLAEKSLSKRSGQKMSKQGIEAGKEPCMEGWIDLLQKEGQVCGSVDQIRSLPTGVYSDGEEGRVCNGAQADGGNSGGQISTKGGVCASHQPRCHGQSVGESDAFCDECGSQAVRTRAGYQAALATVTPIEYSGVIFCPTVSTGAFVARRSGKVFITGNSGFPKSLNIGKAVSKLMGEEREVVGEKTTPDGKLYSARTPNSSGEYNENCAHNSLSGRTKHNNELTKGTSEWEGWGTALKPALEPITVARKPLSEPTVAQNVLKWGTGGLDIDGSRVATDDDRSRKGGEDPGMWSGKKQITTESHSAGRFPANLIHDGSEEVVGLFPNTKSGKGTIGTGAGTEDQEIYGKGKGGTITSSFGDSGSAARFFYCAKASKSERNAGCEDMEAKHKRRDDGQPYGMNTNQFRPDGSERKEVPPQKNFHPTVKPVALMEYLIGLVSRKGAVILDPFGGSGTTGVAAKNIGREYILIERDAEYFKLIQSRLKHVEKPTPASGQLSLLF